MCLLHVFLRFCPYALPNVPYIVHIFLKHPTYIAPKLIAPHFILYSFLKSLLFVVYIRCANRRGYNTFLSWECPTIWNLVLGEGGGGLGFQIVGNSQDKMHCILSKCSTNYKANQSQRVFFFLDASITHYQFVSSLGGRVTTSGNHTKKLSIYMVWYHCGGLNIHLSIYLSINVSLQWSFGGHFGCHHQYIEL
jgi:hypothetical protein